MTYIIISGVAVLIFAILACFMFKINPLAVVACVIFCATFNAIIMIVDYNVKTSDTETYSGKITSVKHVEEWDEWHPPKTESYTTTDSKGKTVTRTRLIAGYTEHHYSENHITTSDNGRMKVTATPDGTKLTDKFVNSNEELQEYYPINSPTASIHTYENKVKASYSIYKNKDINLEQYPDLPIYPTGINSDFSITRILGDIPNKDIAVETLNVLNSALNDTKNPNNTGNTKSYKQCNVIFVNLGDKPQDYAYALQDHWEGGKKNDFIIAFGTKDDKVTWCYPITWSEVESLKTDVRDYMLDKADLNNFDVAITDIGSMIEAKFERKQFADFNYINIETSTSAKLFMCFSTIIACIAIIIVSND